MAFRSKSYVLVLALVVAFAFTGWRWWQGPTVAVYTVQQAPLVQRVVASGRVTNQARLTVGTEVAGEVVARHVNEGDRVAAGALLLELRADTLKAQIRELEIAQADLIERLRPQANTEFARAEIEYAQAERELQRRADLLAAALVPQEAYEQALRLRDLAQLNLNTARTNVVAFAENGAEQQGLEAQLEALQAQLNKTQIRAPAAGVVLTRSIENGDIAQPGQALFTVALDGVLEVRSQLDERNLGQLAVGQYAQVIADAYPQQPFVGEVSFIAPAVDPQRGTIEVRLTVTAPEQFLRQDMTVSVNIETARRENTLVVPNEAIFRTNSSEATVYTVRNNKIEQRSVALGLRGLTQTEVVSGLNAGDFVIIERADNMSAGDRVRVQEAKETVTTASR
ncbi:efflux RND transporter periplasmic adaptor subunit [Aliidiomarina celeris]|uniref:efflux RND transporter periplasmic adaptor subunit n=1 Tax=Aliidiomarina celeris TaxID=2249428 RepID=UPI001300AA90|nr:efflux RND transporter periplasmic adaptor subunit [Aliidiomarina celeris]